MFGVVNNIAILLAGLHMGYYRYGYCDTFVWEVL